MRGQIVLATSGQPVQHQSDGADESAEVAVPRKTKPEGSLPEHHKYTVRLTVVFTCTDRAVSSAESILQALDFLEKATSPGYLIPK